MSPPSIHFCDMVGDTAGRVIKLVTLTKFCNVEIIPGLSDIDAEEANPRRALVAKCAAVACRVLQCARFVISVAGNVWQMPLAGLPSCVG